MVNGITLGLTIRRRWRLVKYARWIQPDQTRLDQIQLDPTGI